MSDTSKKNDRAQFLTSLALVGAGAFLVLICVLTLKKGGIPEGGGAAAMIARGTLGTFGMIPCLIAGLSVLAAGCWIFLTERQDGVWKQLGGALCTAFALSILFGALSPTAGGTFGALSGGTVSGVATKAGGLLFGVVMLAAPVWLFWLKDRVDLDRFTKSAPRPAADAEMEDAGVSAQEAEALAPVLSAGAKAPTLVNPYPEDVRLKGAVPEGARPLDADGHVAVAEPTFDDQPADELDSPYDPALNRWTPAGPGDADESADDDLAEADVDDDGGAELFAATAAPAVDRDADLDDDEDEDELGEVRPLEDPVGDADDPFAEHRYDVEPEVTALVDDEPAPAGAEAESSTRTLVEAYQPPRPSWEESYEDELTEAVPLEVAEALEDDSDAALEDEDDAAAAAALAIEEELEDDVEEAEDADDELEEAQAELDEDEADDDEEEYEDEDAEEEDDETYAEADEDEDEDDEEEYEYEEEEEPEDELEETFAEADEDDEAEYEDEDAEEELEETYAEADEDEDEDGEDEYEEEEEPEDELEETYAEADEDDEDDDEDDEEEYEDEDAEEELEETHAEADEDEDEYEEEEEPEDELEETYAEADEDGEDEDEEDAEEAEDDAEEEELEETYAEADDDEQEADEDEADEAEDLEDESEPLVAEDEAPATESTPAPAAARTRDEVQMDLFDEPVAADSGDSEPEVVLEPQAAAGDGAIKVTSDMLVDAGNLFLQEGRVAVSMLQKRFALDFDQSCRILDELQELGLIGPFVDGKRRDILLSSEEWLELTGRPLIRREPTVTADEGRGAPHLLAPR